MAQFDPNVSSTGDSGLDGGVCEDDNPRCLAPVSLSVAVHGLAGFFVFLVSVGNEMQNPAPQEKNA